MRGHVKIVGICGSPRRGGNTEYLLRLALEEAEKGGAEAKPILLCDKEIKPCYACRLCVEKGECCVQDDMCEIYPKLLEADALILATPVFFNNVTSPLKAFMDRTWCLRGKLRNKIGGAIAVGRRYGIEAALEAINAFFLKHEMIPANRGVSGFAYEKGEIEEDEVALADARRLARRILELGDSLASGPIKPNG